jgi:hypothetical protein
MILKRIVNNRMAWCKMYSVLLRIGRSGGLLQTRYIETSFSIKWGELLEQLENPLASQEGLCSGM